MAAPAQNVWAAKAAEREREKQEARNSDPKGMQRHENQAKGRHDGMDKSDKKNAGSDAITTIKLKVRQDCAGFVVGPKGRVINEIAQQTETTIFSPRKGEEPIFVISGAKVLVNAASALIRAKEHEALEREAKDHKDSTRTSVVVVPESLVGFVMGSQHVVIDTIAYQSRTQIKCPIKGGKPEFEVTGTPICIEAAKACIEAKVYQASIVPWQESVENVTINLSVPADRVGLVVGPSGSVIQGIALQTCTTIVSPKRGQDPIFVITGPQHCVFLAQTAIEQIVQATGKHGHKDKPGFRKGKRGNSRYPAVDAVNRPIVVDGCKRGAP